VTDLLPSSTPTEEPLWRFSERILFRFAFCYILLYYTTTILTAIPGVALLGNWCSHIATLMIQTVVAALLHIDRIDAHFTGSGDTTFAYIQQALVLLVAFTATIVWTMLDRSSSHNATLQSWLHVFARYALAFTLIQYAIVKIIPTQFFVHLQNRQLSETYGQSSPMGLLWNFMAFSTPYTIFSGIAELIPAIFLLFRRTALLGALTSFAVLLNVVMLNLCYDVPVKLYSLNLLLLSALLILPESRRLLRFFLLNQPAPPSNLRAPLIKNSRMQRLIPVLKLGVLTLVVFSSLSRSLGYYRKMASLAPPRPSKLTSRGFHWVQEIPYNY
jgi:hypothetical protein